VTSVAKMFTLKGVQSIDLSKYWMMGFLYVLSVNVFVTLFAQ
jgi:hypothetical protein